ncbi:MAG: RNA methyltransferase [Bacteroidota bacterium]|nr:TrmH family RNA methyltransferase [Odoribacter sp.]MDP3642872.1 RNA methyltransferase [Bacteroidota bacterium]
MNHKLIQFLSEFVTVERLALFNQILSFRTNYLTVVLEDIYQAQNASAVVRTADCFGVQNIHVIENKNVFHVNPDVVRGASNWITVNRYNGHKMNTQKALKKLRQEGYRIVLASPHEHNVNLEDFDLEKGKAAIVFGCERPGLSEWAKKEADEFLKIPMVGFTESLNVSVAVAVTLHHLTHQLRHIPSINWYLTDEEKQRLLLEWLRVSIKRVDLLEEKFYELNK